MAKVHPLQNAPRTAYGTRGAYVLAGTKHGIVASKWPRKRGKATQGYDFYRQTEFGLVASLVASPNPYDYGTAVEMAKGTEQVPRDILQMAAMGVYYIFRFKNGDEWIGERLLQPNVQYILDQLGGGPGSIIYRAEIGWVTFNDGEAGQVLTFDGFRPIWADPTGGGGSSAPPRMLYPQSFTLDGRNAATLGTVYRSRMPMEISHLGAFVLPRGGSTFELSLWSLAGNDLDIKLGACPPITSTVSTDLYIEAALPTPVAMLADARYAMLVTRTDGGTSPLEHTIRSNQAPDGASIYTQSSNIYLNSIAPGVGDTLNIDNDYRCTVLKGTW